MGTNYTHLKQIAERSGVHIVGSGGYYLQTTYPPEVTSQSEDQLVDGLVKDAATYRWGAFGEIGSSPEMTADERKVFRVIAKTAREPASRCSPTRLTPAARPARSSSSTSSKKRA